MQYLVMVKYWFYYILFPRRKIHALRPETRTVKSLLIPGANRWKTAGYKTFNTSEMNSHAAVLLGDFHVDSCSRRTVMSQWRGRWRRLLLQRSNQPLLLAL